MTTMTRPRKPKGDAPASQPKDAQDVVLGSRVHPDIAAALEVIAEKNRRTKSAEAAVASEIYVTCDEENETLLRKRGLWTEHLEKLKSLHERELKRIKPEE